MEDLTLFVEIQAPGTGFTSPFVQRIKTSRSVFSVDFLLGECRKFLDARGLLLNEMAPSRIQAIDDGVQFDIDESYLLSIQDKERLFIEFGQAASSNDMDGRSSSSIFTLSDTSSLQTGSTMTKQLGNESTDQFNQSVTSVCSSSSESIPAHWQEYKFSAGQAFDVESILRGTTEGKRFMDNRSESFSLSRKEHTRTRVVYLCTQYLLEKKSELSGEVTKRNRALMAFSIVQTFPELYLKDSVFGWGYLFDVKTARGFLGQCYYNCRSNSSKITTRRYVTTKRNAATASLDEEESAFDLEKFHAVRLELERTKPTPLTKGAIEEKMASTRQYRQEFIKKSNCHITSVLKEWPRFLDMPSLILDEYAFLTSPDVKLADQWEKYASHICSIVLQRRGSEALMDWFQIFSVRSVEHLQNLSSEEISVLALASLPFLLKPAGRRKCGRNTASLGANPALSTYDALSSVCSLSYLFQFHEAAKPITSIIDDSKRDTLLKQPFLVMLTPSGTCTQPLDITEIFLVLDHKPILVDGNLSRAIEYLFASFFVFDVEYPEFLRPVYHFLELVFGIPDSLRAKGKARSPTAMVLKDEADRLMESNE